MSESNLHAAPVTDGSSEQWTAEHQMRLESLVRSAENLHHHLIKPLKPDHLHPPGASQPAKETIELHAAPATKPLEGWPRHLANAALGLDTKKLDEVQHVQGSMDEINDIGTAFYHGLHL